MRLWLYITDIKNDKEITLSDTNFEEIKGIIDLFSSHIDNKLNFSYGNYDEKGNTILEGGSMI